MTTILNEMICGTIDSTTGNINLSGDLKVTKDGNISSINSGSIYDVTDGTESKKYIGSYNITPDAMEPSKKSIYINVSDFTKLAEASTAITTMITDIENKYKSEMA